MVLRVLEVLSGIRSAASTVDPGSTGTNVGPGSTGTTVGPGSTGAYCTVDPGSSGQSLDGVGPGSSGSYLVGAGEKENRLYAGLLGLLPQPISRM